jgi:nucleoid-associated protein YgaU
MPNPLRLPIVLIVILATMAIYVHGYHRSQTSATDNGAPIHDRLQLRQPPGRSPISNSLSESPLIQPSARETTDGRAGESAASADTSRSLPLPRVDVPRDDAPPSAQPAATLSGPIQFPSSSTSAVSVPATQPGAASAPVASAEPTYSPSNEPPRHLVMHRVVDGDSLPRLAERYLGDERRAGEILEANRDVLLRPDLLPLGVRLRIPTSP